MSAYIQLILSLCILTVCNINIIVLCYSNDKIIACGNLPNCHAINVAIQNTFNYPENRPLFLCTKYKLFLFWGEISPKHLLTVFVRFTVQHFYSLFINAINLFEKYNCDHTIYGDGKNSSKEATSV